MTAASLFVSCGQRQQAKSVIKDFMEQSLHKDVKYLDFSDLDSTKAISDSVIMVMRQRDPRVSSIRITKTEHYCISVLPIWTTRIPAAPPSIWTVRQHPSLPSNRTEELSGR